MAETKTHAALAAQGFKPGDPAFVGIVVFGDQDDPTIDQHTVGTYKTLTTAKRAVAAEVRRLTATETRDGWWTGDVSPGTIEDRSGDWGAGYGHVQDWDWEPDYRVVSTFYACGKWQ